MKTKLLYALMAVILLILPTKIVAQASTLGTANDFVLFTSIGAVTNTGISQLTGNVGTNNGGITGFGNVNGVMQNANGGSAQAAADILLAYNQLKNAVPTFFPAPLLGNGATLFEGVYSITAATTLSNTLTLDAQGNSNAVFIFQIEAPFATLVNSNVVLINGALACNVFWKIEGLVSIASGTSMKGTIIANNAAIEIGAGSTLEGRALSTSGAISVTGVLGYTPVGCGSTFLTGPTQPNLGSTICYALFSASGALANEGISKVKGDVGTNVGLTPPNLGSASSFTIFTAAGAITNIGASVVTGDVGNVTGAYDFTGGTIYGSHFVTGSAETVAAKTDLDLAYDYISTLSGTVLGVTMGDITLTPGIYQTGTLTTLDGTLTLDGQGDPNALFIIKIGGAFATGSGAIVQLINSASLCNVFWQIDGQFVLGDHSKFIGNVLANGAINLLEGSSLQGRALSIAGAVTLHNNEAMTPGCVTTNLSAISAGKEVIDFSPNPFGAFTSVHIENVLINEMYIVRIYNLLAQKVIETVLTDENTLLQTSQLSAGMYTYQILKNHRTIQTGKLISKTN